jgi:D-alanyl-D-alanine carboxypeptidase
MTRRTRRLAAAGVVAAMSAGIVSAPGAAATTSRAETDCAPSERVVSDSVCIAQGDERGFAVLDAVNDLRRRFLLRSVIVGVWQDGKPVVRAAMGEAYPGVPSELTMHFRIGDVTQTFTSTLLLQLVERGKVSLTDPVSKWYPALPDAARVTVGMLAGNTSGYADYTTNPRFVDAFRADPFRTWNPDELVQYGTRQPMLFAPGTSVARSDTNAVLLGEILRKVGGADARAQIRRGILEPLRLRDTAMSAAATIPFPVLHGYTGERGLWEDATYWTPSAATYAGDMTSDLADLGRWARALGAGTLLSRASRARQVAPAGTAAATGAPTPSTGLGVDVANGWVVATGRPPGYTGLIADLPAQKTAIVVFTTATPQTPPGTQYAAALFDAIAPVLVPSAPPGYPS